MKTWLKTLLKLIVAALAFYLVFRKVSWNELQKTLQMIRWPWVLLAYLLYNFSQWVSGYRLLGFYKQLDIPITYRQNLAVYYKAMFYGLFLPGGVSGDAYKVITLQKRFNRTYKEMIVATISDRVNGLVVLLSLVLAIVAASGNRLHGLLDPWYLPMAIAWVAGCVMYYFLKKRFASPHHRIIISSTLLSIVNQSLQILAFFSILKGLDISAQDWLYYGVLFYAGGIVSALPISIGGMGLREWTMVTGSGIFGLSPAIAFAASFIFFLVASVTSLSGSIVPLPASLQEKEIPPSSGQQS